MQVGTGGHISGPRVYLGQAATALDQTHGISVKWFALSDSLFRDLQDEFRIRNEGLAGKSRRFASREKLLTFVYGRASGGHRDLARTILF